VGDLPDPRPASRYQNSGYPTGAGIVETLVKEAEPYIAVTPNPAKTRELLLLDRRLLELYVSRGRAITIYTNRKAALGLK